MTRHRHLVVERGSRAETREAARRRIGLLAPDDVLWVESGGGDDVTAVPPHGVRKILGRSFDAVVLDVHTGLDADVLGQCHGFVRGGGALVLRMPERGARPDGGRDRLAAHPYTAADVGRRFYRRFERKLGAPEGDEVPATIPPVSHDLGGTEEQARLARRLADRFAVAGARSVVLADRGRGKSSALGMAIERAAERATLRFAVTGPSKDAVGEVFRFAPTERDLRFVDPLDLLHADEEFDVVVIDEAAQVSVAMLRRLVGRHGAAHLVFATTAHGYEGTGRGFGLRFLDWLDEQPGEVEVFELEEPIRWAANDPLEAFVFDALLLDAEVATAPEITAPHETRHVMFDRDELAADETTLREFFGLLVQAHYRTTPGDLHRMLDAPNIDLHGLFADGHVVAASLVAREGNLASEICDDLHSGRRRITGHALPETLVSHLGYRDAGRWDMVRSVRIAVHPELRRLGLGSHLVERVHTAYEGEGVDLFGTLFGAEPELLAFRRSLGYELVRVSSSRNRRTGEPSVTMIRPKTDRSRDLCDRLRADLARDLPVKLALMQAGDEPPVEPRLVEALRERLPTPEPITDRRVDEIVDHYAHGPRTFESAAVAIERFLREHSDRLERLAEDERTLVEARVLDRTSWAQAAERAGFVRIGPAMRALRRAVRALLEP